MPPRNGDPPFAGTSKPQETGMTRLTLRNLALAALATLPGLAVVDAAPADAPPFSAQGAWADCNIVTSFRQAGPLLRITVDISQTFTGTLEGGYVGTEDVTVFPDGTATFTGEGTFTGAVDGRAGRAAYRYDGTVDAQGVGAATWSLDHGTDGLAKLRGNGTFSGTGISPQTTRFTPADPSVCDGGMYGGAYQGTLKYTSD
jgi:Protein of unknown function (DUF3224)